MHSNLRIYALNLRFVNPRWKNVPFTAKRVTHGTQAKMRSTQPYQTLTMRAWHGTRSTKRGAKITKPYHLRKLMRYTERRCRRTVGAGKDTMVATDVYEGPNPNPQGFAVLRHVVNISQTNQWMFVGKNVISTGSVSRAWLRCSMVVVAENHLKSSTNASGRRFLRLVPLYWYFWYF